MDLLRQILDIIKSKAFLINLLAMLILFFALVFGIRAYLDSYTLHGETISVPDLQGGSFEEAEKILDERGLNAILKDSVHIQKAEPGEIVEHDPEAERKVKRGRNIYITIQATNKEKVDMPDLIDRSRRQAVSILRSVGLEVKDVHFEPDICVDCVIEQRHNGNPIDPGTRIPKGSGIELVLGAGKGDNKTKVPSVIGMTIEEAESRLLQATLNVGALKFDESCCETAKDSAKAKVYDQAPSAGGDRVNSGSSVTLWLSTDEERVKEAKVEDNTNGTEEAEAPQELDP